MNGPLLWLDRRAARAVRRPLRAGLAPSRAHESRV